MKTEALAAQWIAETERVADLVRHEFMFLNEQQLTYKMHVDHCSIRQLMQQALSANRDLLARIERALPAAGSAGREQEYRPGYLAGYLLNRMAAERCKAEKITGRGDGLGELSPGMLFSEITGQQNKIKELVTLCKSVDMNRRVVPFRLHGLIRLSIGETFDYLVHYQKRCFVMARQLAVVSRQ